MVPMVLAVDDDRSSQILMQAYLEDEQFCRQFIGHNSAESAVEFLKDLTSNGSSTEFPDVIFLDIQMPGMDGWEFIDAITPMMQEMGKLPAIILLSATNTADDIEKAASHPMVLDIATKPISTETLTKIRDYSNIKPFFESVATPTCSSNL